MIDADSQEYLRRIMEVTTAPIDELTPKEAREVSRRFTEMFPWEVTAGVESLDALVAGPGGAIHVRVFTPRRREELMPVLLYFHGGGWVVGGHADPDVDSTCRYLADAGGCTVVSVGYRLAPESKFPAAVEDAYASLLWVVGNSPALGLDPSRVAVAGDSAGANIAAALCLMARDRKGPEVVLQALVYPIADCDFETESYRTCGEGYGLATEEMKWYWNQYLSSDGDRDNPYVSIARATSLTGLPPALVLTAEYDPLRDEGEAYAKRLEEAGVPTRLVRYDGAIHGFFTLPFGGKGRAEVAKELRRAFEQAAPAQRRAGLQSRWGYVFDSLEDIIPIYEQGSRRIALFSDTAMRRAVVSFAVRTPGLVLDLGSGPGTLAKVVSTAGGTPVLVDASRRMLSKAGPQHRVQAVFEALPFRDGAFEAIVAGFSLRDARDLVTAVEEVRRVTASGGRFAFCDLGKPDSFLKAVALGAYIRVGVPTIGAITGGYAGTKFKSLFDTYVLTLKNGVLSSLLRRYFSSVEMRERQLGGSIEVCCTA